jgi:hypothetical protein
LFHNVASWNELLHYSTLDLTSSLKVVTVTNLHIHNFERYSRVYTFTCNAHSALEQETKFLVSNFTIFRILATFIHCYDFPL